MSLASTHTRYLSKVFFICILIVFVGESRKLSHRQHQLYYGNRKSYTDPLYDLLKTILSRRTINLNTLTSSRTFYEALKKKLLRHDDQVLDIGTAPNINEDKMADIVEHELQDSLAKKSSALMERPFVQHKGKNDFLVLKPGIQDPFVTVVPNDIYYNVEKPCVNWLDDCNLRGLRARLLQKVQSPYR